MGSSTETPGSSQNAQIAAPRTRSPAATMNGACQEPNWTSTPKTIGDKAPPILPAMFIMPETVPGTLPPTSIGTAQDGPIVHSRKNIAPVRQYTAVWASSVNAAGTIKQTQPNRPTIATERRASLVFPVLCSSQSVASPPTVSPMTPANNGREANRPTFRRVKCRKCTRKRGSRLKKIQMQYTQVKEAHTH